VSLGRWRRATSSSGNSFSSATFCYLRHDFRDAEPISVAVPRFRDGIIEAEAVFRSAAYGSPAGDAWTLLRRGRLPSVSIYAVAQDFYRGADGRLVRGVLTSIDLCEQGKDERAQVTNVVAAQAMTPADPRSPPHRTINVRSADVVPSCRGVSERGTATSDDSDSRRRVQHARLSPTGVVPVLEAVQRQRPDVTLCAPRVRVSCTRPSHWANSPKLVCASLAAA
jgi:hypothetical protein